MCSTGAESPQASLRATYTSPQLTNDFQHLLKAPPNPASVDQKRAYLSELLSSVKLVQEEVNAFLTRKMEDDKVLAQGAKAPRQEEKEEENYGEEIVGDND